MRLVCSTSSVGQFICVEFEKSLNKSNKIFVCVSVCTEGSGYPLNRHGYLSNVLSHSSWEGFNYFSEGYHHTPKRNHVTIEKKGGIQLENLIANYI